MNLGKYINQQVNTLTLMVVKPHVRYEKPVLRYLCYLRMRRPLCPHAVYGILRIIARTKEHCCTGPQGSHLTPN